MRSPHTLADDPAATAEQHLPIGPGPGESPRLRLTVREMQIALDAARCHDALEGNSSVTPPIVASAPPVTRATTEAPTATRQTHLEPWLPEHDGPVSLAGAAAPRVRRSRPLPSRPDKPARRHPERKAATRASKRTTPALDRVRAALNGHTPPRLVLVQACGGAGATTLATMLATALAPATQTLAVAGNDAGALTARCGAEGGDYGALAIWAGGCEPAPLGANTPGVGTARSGDASFLVAAPSRRYGQITHPARTELQVLTAMARISTAIVIDTPGLGADFTEQALRVATHVMIVAPQTVGGLLDGEFTAAALAELDPAPGRMALVHVNVQGRSAGRAGRAALARLGALGVPVAAVPHDRGLSTAGPVRWAALRPRTGAAVVAVLAQLLQREDEKRA